MDPCIFLLNFAVGAYLITLADVLSAMDTIIQYTTLTPQLGFTDSTLP